MKKLVWSAIFAGTVFLSCLRAPGQPTIPITVQGTLQSPSGPLNGAQTMTFRIFSSPTGAVPLWTETLAVNFTNGVYSATLGETTPLTGIFPNATAPRWLSVQLGSNPAFSPRQRLTATPYANFSAVAGTANAVSGKPLNWFAPRSAAVLDSAETLSTLRGTVAAAGTVQAGGGFTCSQTGTGIYNVIIDPAHVFGGSPSVTASPTTTNILLAVTSSSPSAFTVAATRRSDGAAENSGFHFTAMGPRPPAAGTDADGDGFAVFPHGFDCDDSNPNVYPGAAELCNGVDDDCDGNVDNGVGTVYYLDGDGDGFGGQTSVTACVQPPGTLTTSTDCNDSDPDVHPGAAEVCNNSADDNCDGTIDNMRYYRDQDNDTFGNPADFVNSSSCTPPTGYVTDKTDCDDQNPNVNPGRPDTCGDGTDNNCNGDIDEGC